MRSTAQDELAAIAAIRRLKARYCRFVDTKQWTRLQGLFAPGASVAGFGAVPDGADAAAFVVGVAERLAPAVSIHHVHEPEIAVTAPGAARAIWPMMDYVEFPPGAAEQGGWVGWGWYEEDYVRRDGEWLIAFMRLARQRMDGLGEARAAPRAGRLKPDAHWL